MAPRKNTPLHKLAVEIARNTEYEYKGIHNKEEVAPNTFYAKKQAKGPGELIYIFADRAAVNHTNGIMQEYGSMVVIKHPTQLKFSANNKKILALPDIEDNAHSAQKLYLKNGESPEDYRRRLIADLTTIGINVRSHHSAPKKPHYAGFRLTDLAKAPAQLKKALEFFEQYTDIFAWTSDPDKIWINDVLPGTKKTPPAAKKRAKNPPAAPAAADSGSSHVVRVFTKEILSQLQLQGVLFVIPDKPSEEVLKGKTGTQVTIITQTHKELSLEDILKMVK